MEAQLLRLRSRAVKSIKDREWSAGNGQCSTCHGLSPQWAKAGQNWGSLHIGHKPTCSTALNLQAMGDLPTMMGQPQQDNTQQRRVN